MTVKGGTAVAAAFAACLVTACGSSGSNYPHTPANVAVCKVLEQVLAGAVSAQQLAASVLESNASVSHGLRQDLAQYAILVVSGGASAARRAEAKAKQDCQPIIGS